MRTLPLALLAACGGGAPGLDLVATATSLQAGGHDHATIAVYASSLPDGTLVALAADHGSFVELVAGADPVQSAQVATSGGRASTTFYSDRAPGSGVVTATAYDPSSGDMLTASLTFTFTGARVASFSVRCNAVNVAALATQDMEVTCQPSATSSDGSALDTDALDVTMRAEAGTIEPTMSADGHRVWIYRPVGGAMPVETDPQDGEPSRSDASGDTRNPRDGLVTILAITRGPEPFDDTNGNGVHDNGEPFTDLPEPFLDADDSGDLNAVGAAHQQEYFLDDDGNGMWSGGNGRWDPDKALFAMTHILWTGAPDEGPDTTHFIVPGSGTDLPNDGQVTATLMLVDANLNPVAAFAQNADTLTFATDDTSVVTLTGAADVTLGQSLGFALDDRGLPDWSRLSQPRYPVMVHDADGMTMSDMPAGWTVYATLAVTPGPLADGSYLPQATSRLTMTLAGTSR